MIKKRAIEFLKEGYYRHGRLAGGATAKSPGPL
jgi:hypothetical protein